MNSSSNLLIIIISLIYGASSGHLLMVNRRMSLMLEFTAHAPFCYLRTDRNHIQNTILNTEPRRVKIISDVEINNLEIICRKRQMKSSYQGGFIYPGTKWCGPRASTTNYTDLGIHRREDICCREHDHCPNALRRGECKQGICNKSLYTRSHCDCDAEFRRCLQNVNSETANTIGAIFFNIIQVVCFKQKNTCLKFQSSSSFELSKVLTKNAKSNNCSMEFHLSEKYIPSEVIFHYRTKGELVESYLNKFLKKINYL